MIHWFLGITFYFLIDLITNHLTERRYSRKCGYDCYKCRNWKCSFHHCNRKRMNMSHEDYKHYLSTLDNSAHEGD